MHPTAETMENAFLNLEVAAQGAEEKQAQSTEKAQTLPQFSLQFRQRPAAGFSKLLKANDARVAKLADARDLKSRVPNGTCGFDSRPGHQPRFDLPLAMGRYATGCRQTTGFRGTLHRSLV